MSICNFPPSVCVCVAVFWYGISFWRQNIHNNKVVKSLQVEGKGMDHWTLPAQCLLSTLVQNFYLRTFLEELGIKLNLWNMWWSLWDFFKFALLFSLYFGKILVHFSSGSLLNLSLIFLCFFRRQWWLFKTPTQGYGIRIFMASC